MQLVWLHGRAYQLYCFACHAILLIFFFMISRKLVILDQLQLHDRAARDAVKTAAKSVQLTETLTFHSLSYFVWSSL